MGKFVIFLIETAAELAGFQPGYLQVFDPDASEVFKEAERLRQENYGAALVMPRTWKSALAPFLAGIPRRTGFVGEARFLLLNDLRWGERRLERMIDRCGALALPRDARLPHEWPLPELVVPADAVGGWRARRGLQDDRRPVVTLAPGAVGMGKAWPAAHYSDLARRLTQSGTAIWVLGGPNETALARAITAAGGAPVRDLTGTDLRDAILALKAANAAVTNAIVSPVTSHIARLEFFRGTATAAPLPMGSLSASSISIRTPAASCRR